MIFCSPTGNLTFLAEVEIDGDFLISRTGPADKIRDSSPYQTRSVDQVHGNEMELAVRNVVRDARGANRAEVVEAVSRASGWNRTSAAIATAISATIDRLTATGELDVNGAGIRLG